MSIKDKFKYIFKKNKINKKEITDYNMNIIDFIFRAKYDIKFSSVELLKLPVYLEYIMYYYFKDYGYDTFLFDWLTISNEVLISIPQMNADEVNEYRNCINNFLIGNKIDPQEFYEYAYKMKWIDFCLKYNINLINFEEAYKVMYNYIYNGNNITIIEKENIKSYLSNMLINYYTDTIYTGKEPDNFSIDFNNYTGHTFQEFVEDCFKESA